MTMVNPYCSSVRMHTYGMVRLRQGFGKPSSVVTGLLSTQPSTEEEEDLPVDTDVLILRGVTRVDSGMYRCKSLDVETYMEMSSELKVVVNCE